MIKGAVIACCFSTGTWICWCWNKSRAVYVYRIYIHTHIYIYMYIYIHILLYNSYPLYIGFSQQYFGHSPKKKGWCSWDLPSDSDQMQGLNQQHQQPKGAWLYLHRQHWFKGKNTGKLCEGFKKNMENPVDFALNHIIQWNKWNQQYPTMFWE